MTVPIGLLRRLVGRYLPSIPAAYGVGQRIQMMEQDIARRRLLDQARGGQQAPAGAGDTSMSRERRVSYDEYLFATALTLARRHRPVWSWRLWRRICRCGSDLPCHARHRIPINRGHWPSEGEQ